MIIKEDIEKIRNAVDIVEYLKSRGTEVNRSGVSWVGLCPIHSERSPSFHVKPEAKTFHCFGCGRGGDIFTLVQEMDDLSFMGSILSLAEYADIELQEEEDDNFKKIQRLYKLTNLASSWFRKNFEELDDEHPAKLNLSERGLLDLAKKDNSIGFSPNSGLLQYLTAAKFTMDEIVEVGLASRSEDKPDQQPNARFRQRLIWSIRNIQGKTVGFSARKIYDTDNGPKYINSPQTTLFNKSKTLLGLDQAHKTITEQQSVYVVEGQTDVMAFREAGILNVVATCGTAFGKDHSIILQRLADRAKTSKKFTINFCFDGDAAGINAAKKVFSTDNSLQTSANVISLGSEDPDDLRKNHGNDALIKALENKVSLLEFILKNELKEWDVTNPEGQAGFLKQASMLLNEIDDPSLLEAYQRKVSYWSGAPLSTIVNRNYGKRRTSSMGEEQSSVQAVSLGTLRQRVIASVLQYPIQGLKAIKEFKINDSMFQNSGKTLFTEAVTVAEAATVAGSYSFDPSNFTEPTLAVNLLHEEIITTLDETDERIQEIVNAICKVFTTNYNINENNKLQTRLLNMSEEETSESSDEDLFREIMESRKDIQSPRKAKRITRI